MSILKRETHTFGLFFFITRTRPDRHGLCPLQCRISVDGNNTNFTVKQSISPSDWSEKGGYVIGKSRECQKIKTYLEDIKSRVKEHYRRLRTEGRPVTAILLKNLLLGHDPDKKPEPTLIPLFRELVEEKKQLAGKEYVYATYQKYNRAMNSTIEFIRKEYKADDIPLKDLNWDFIHKLELFYRVDKQCSHNTATKYLQNLRSVVLIAIRKQFITTDPFANYKLTIKEVEKGYLTDEELKTLINTPIKIPRLEQIRDMFVFSCFTGLAYSDIKGLAQNNLEHTPDGTLWIKGRRKKTGIRFNIPILPLPLSILKKYEGTNDKTLFPIPSNQKTNAYLKELADLCGISKNITFHVARHTFATTVTLSNDVPIETVSSMLGHTNIRMTQHYAKIVTSKVKRDMEKLKNLLHNETLLAG